MLAGSEGIKPYAILDQFSFDVLKTFQEWACKKDGGVGAECVPGSEAYILNNGSTRRGDGKAIVADRATPDMVTTDPELKVDAAGLAYALELDAENYYQCVSDKMMTTTPPESPPQSPYACYDPVELALFYDPVLEECRATFVGDAATTATQYIPAASDPATAKALWDKVVKGQKGDQYNFRSGHVLGALKDTVTTLSGKIQDFTAGTTAISEDGGVPKQFELREAEKKQTALKINILKNTTAEPGQSAEDQLVSGKPVTGAIDDVAAWRKELTEVEARIATLKKVGSPDKQQNAMLTYANAMMHCFQDTAHDLGADWRALSAGKDLSIAPIVQCAAPTKTETGEPLSFTAIDIAMNGIVQGDSRKVDFANLVRAMKMYTDAVKLRGTFKYVMSQLPKAAVDKLEQIAADAKSGKLTPKKAEEAFQKVLKSDEVKAYREKILKLRSDVDEKLGASDTFLGMINPDDLDPVQFELFLSFQGMLNHEKELVKQIFSGGKKEVEPKVAEKKPAGKKPAGKKPAGKSGFKCSMGFKALSAMPAARFRRYQTWKQANCK